LQTDRRTDRQTDRQTDRRTGQKLYAPDLSIRGHKNIAATVFDLAQLCLRVIWSPGING
jgi:hypothetical protein